MNELKKGQPCPHCGRYDNRGVTIDVVIIEGDKILLIKRGNSPFKGNWALPGGFVGWDETTEETVIKEAKEETNLEVGDLRLVGVYSLPERHPKQVINVAYLAGKAEGDVKVGDDALDFKWFSLDNLPEKLAFDHKKIINDAKKINI